MHEKIELNGLTRLAKQVYLANKEKGFWPEDGSADVNFGERIALITSELSEALEAHRNGRKPVDLSLFESALQRTKANPDTSPETYATLFKAHVKDSVEDELADAIIRILDLCGGKGIDIASHIAYKLKYNQTRPHKHGKLY